MIFGAAGVEPGRGRRGRQVEFDGPVLVISERPDQGGARAARPQRAVIGCRRLIVVTMIERGAFGVEQQGPAGVDAPPRGAVERIGGRSDLEADFELVLADSLLRQRLDLVAAVAAG
jgi:hypothetical protein